MSNTKNITLEDLDHFWLPNGAPCFLANKVDICDDIEALGFQIYYLIGHKATTTNTTSTYKAGSPTVTTPNTTYKSKMFKVVNNFVGRAVSIVEEDFGVDMVSIDDEAGYTMPAIPSIIIDKLDEFFRLVHAQHGTESIVLLTYDTTKTGSDGWGILVPEQSNTAAHCKYDPDSIVDLKEDHIMIVGSVHSHPEMPAYASGTDHSDQADFDGLHITYGWQKSVSNGATQYHLELQMGGTAYSLTAADVFEDRALVKDPDPDVIEWSAKVKKALPPQQAGVPTLGTGIIPLNQAITALQGTIPQGSIPGGVRTVEKRPQVVPFDKLTYNGLIAAEIDLSGSGSMICPSCYLALFKSEIYQGSSCPACDIPTIAMNHNIDDIVNSLDSYQIYRGFSTKIPYYIWAIDVVSDEDIIMMIKPYDTKAEYNDIDGVIEYSILDDRSPVYLPSESKEDWIEESIFDEDLMDKWANATLCCGAILNGENTACDCSVTVLPDDIMDFDEAMSAQNVNLYAKSSVCESCEHYYIPSCPSYKNAIVKFATVAELPENEAVSGCTEWQSYKNSSDYSTQGWDSYGM
jgi:hypothetical protein